MQPLTPADVQAALDAKNTGIQIQFFDQSTATSAEAAAAANTELGSIVKSIVFLRIHSRWWCWLPATSA
ncbi:MAG: hypothetical protein K8I82_12100 [Anaerolineae bacterium]|nr:hypothetical protein [Anaerolineae bacterium]